MSCYSKCTQTLDVEVASTEGVARTVLSFPHGLDDKSSDSAEEQGSIPARFLEFFPSAGASRNQERKTDSMKQLVAVWFISWLLGSLKLVAAGGFEPNPSISLASAVSGLGSSSVDASMLACWRFDESSGTVARDSVGGFHGNLSPTGAAFVSGGISGNALSLNRSANGFVNMGRVLALGGNDFTIAAWIKTQPGDTVNQTVVSRQQAGYENGFGIWINDIPGAYGAPGKAWFYASDPQHREVNSSSTVNDGLWHQIVAVYEKGRNKSMYVDGSPVEATTPSRSILTDDSALFLLGGVSRSGAQYRDVAGFTGLIDEMQVYERALTSSEVDFLFRNPGQVVPAAAPDSPALILNGSFESPAFLPGSSQVLSPGSTALAGWTVSNNGTIAYANGSSSGVTPVDGSQQISFNGADQPVGGSIFQAFSTTIGLSYTVSFFIGRLGFAPGTMGLLAEVDSNSGQVLGSLAATAPATLGYGPLQTFGFKATTTSSTLTFKDISTATVAVDVLLDKVSVVPALTSDSSKTTRRLPFGYAPGVSLTVVLEALPTTNTAAYAVEDRPPTGWSVSSISHGGFFDATTGKVKFGPFFDATPRTLSYQATPFRDDTGKKQFTGSTSIDGASSVIGGDNGIDLAALLHPADRSPADNRISIDELTAYSAAWRRGSSWPVPPSLIPIDYVTRAGFLWKNGESYIFDPQATNATAWWINNASATTVRMLSIKAIKVAGENSAMRHLPVQFVPSNPLLVTVSMAPSPGVLVYAAQEQIPLGWGVNEISHGGEFDAGQRLIKWGPFLDSKSRELSYRVQPELKAAPVAVFEGTASFDGASMAFEGRRESLAGSELASLKRLPGGELELQLIGRPGAEFDLQVSSDLVDWRWLSTVTNQTGRIRFSDPQGSKMRQRFYRAVVR
jgi:hypothetical protein